MNFRIPARGGRTECNTTGVARTWVLVATFSAFGTLGCGVPVLSHLDGRPFTVSGELTMLNGGWAAMDHCELGVHVLVEFEVPENPDMSQVALREDLLLVAGDDFVSPLGLAIEGPFCLDGGAAQFRATEEGQSPHGLARSGVVAANAECRVGYLVRVEFEIPATPRVGDVMRIYSKQDRFLAQSVAIR